MLGEVEGLSIGLDFDEHLCADPRLGLELINLMMMMMMITLGK